MNTETAKNYLNQYRNAVANLQDKREELNGDIKVDVLVIGAGIAGILTGYILSQRGRDVVLIEKDKITSGNTKNTTAKITSQHYLIYDKLINEFGEEKARQYAKANELAIKKYKEIIEERRIDCDFEEVPAFVYSLNEVDLIKKEVEAAKRVGIDAEFVDKINLPAEDEKRNFVRIMNPLGEETSVMRTTLIPNMLDVISTNLSHKVEEVGAFECGNTFKPQEGLPVETKKYCVGMYGKEVDFFVLKGVIEAVLNNVGLKGYEIEPETTNLTFHPGRCAKVVYNNIYIGTFGELHPDVIENYDLGQRVYVAEINIDTVFENLTLTKSYNPLPKYPSTSRDIALIVKDEIFVKHIEDIIKANGEDILESYQLFDVYKGAQIEEGHKSIAYSITYRSKEKTLTDEDVAKVHDKIVSELSEKLNANLRSN